MMRDAWMQVLPPADHCFTSRITIPRALHTHRADNHRSSWTREENKLFENALARFDGEGPERWQRVAEAIPGKTAWDVMAHYRHLEADVTQIEAGLLPFSAFSPCWDAAAPRTPSPSLPPSLSGGKRPPAKTASCDQDRKKGVPWTQEEHRLFLLGLNKYGKGDWRSIARNFVLTRTPTQVASHAQKYFIRLNSGNKDKRRPSIHDITTTNLPPNARC